jgi:hypothetical protein
MSKLCLVKKAHLVILIALVIGASAQQPTRRSNIQDMDSPAATGSAEPNLYATGDGRVLLSWIEPAGENRNALRFAVRKAGKWSEPRRIAEGINWFVNWADFPSVIALSDGSLVAHWLVKSGEGTYAYNINIVRSTDGGETWSKPLVPHRDGTQTEHGFVSMLPWSRNGAGIVWLDGRQFTTKQLGHAEHASSNEMSLRFTTLGSDGRLSEDVLLDSRVCDCCQTSAAMTSEGAVVVYRDRSEKEIRDISIVRFRNGHWTEPRPVSVDGWEINGCPVNGPSVAAEGRLVVVAWFTSAKDTARVKVAFSDDAGSTFAQPVEVDEGTPLGRVQVVILGDRSALVSWMESSPKGANIKVRQINEDGWRGEAATVAESSSARSSGFPRMARVGNEVVFAWTQADKPSRVRTAVGTFANLK